MKSLGQLNVFVVAAALAVCAAGNRAEADLIVGDNFETYTTGDLNGQNGAMSGATGPWGAAYTANAVVDVATGGLSYSNGAISVDGGSQHVVVGGVNNNSLVARPFTSQTGDLYFSFLFQTTATVGDDFLQFTMNNNAADADFSAAIIMTSLYQARITSDGSNATTANSAVAPVVGMPMLLVGKVTKTGGSTNYNRLDLFVNPNSLSEPVTIDATVNRDMLITTLSFFTIRTARLDGGDAYLFDALRVGTTWGDVVSPINYAAVPEPSSFALAAIGAAGFAWRRRRRQVAAGVPSTEASVSQAANS